MSYTREDLEGMKMADLRQLTDAKSTQKEDLIRAILNTPDVELPSKPVPEDQPAMAYEINSPPNWTAKREWYDSLANQYAIDRFQWVEKFRAYRVYRKGVHVDWITWEQLHRLFGEPVPRVKRSQMPQRPMLRDRVIKHID